MSKDPGSGRSLEDAVQGSISRRARTCFGGYFLWHKPRKPMRGLSFRVGNP